MMSEIKLTVYSLLSYTQDNLPFSFAPHAHMISLVPVQRCAIFFLHWPCFTAMQHKMCNTTTP